MILQHQTNNNFAPGAHEVFWAIQIVNFGLTAASPPPPLPSPLAKKQLEGIVDDPEMRGVISTVGLRGSK